RYFSRRHSRSAHLLKVANHQRCRHHRWVKATAALLMSERAALLLPDLCPIYESQPTGTTRKSVLLTAPPPRSLSCASGSEITAVGGMSFAFWTTPSAMSSTRMVPNVG